MDTEHDTIDTQTVNLTVRGFIPVQRKGALLGMAVVDLDVAGVRFTLQGVQLRTTPAGAIEVVAPCFRHPGTGQPLPAAVLPPELATALSTQVVEAWMEATQ